MKTLIAIPCFGMMHTVFAASLLNLKKRGDVKFSLVRDSLVYDARNILVKEALEEDFDRILFIDSDMSFDEDMFLRMSDDMDTGIEYVAGLFFYKSIPTKPVIYRGMFYDDSDGIPKAKLTPYMNYPRDQLFEVAGSGMGAVMISTDAIGKIIQRGERFPFTPMEGLGEDVSFCLKLYQAGVKMYCDSRIKVGHIGEFEVNESQYIKQIQAGIVPEYD